MYLDFDRWFICRFYLFPSISSSTEPIFKCYISLERALYVECLRQIIFFVLDLWSAPDPKKTLKILKMWCNSSFQAKNYDWMLVFYFVQRLKPLVFTWAWNFGENQEKIGIEKSLTTVSSFEYSFTDDVSVWKCFLPNCHWKGFFHAIFVSLLVYDLKMVALCLWKSF